MFVIEITASDGQDFTTPKYFTGRFQGRWPEYSLKQQNAFRFLSKSGAGAVATSLRELNFTCEVKPVKTEAT